MITAASLFLFVLAGRKTPVLPLTAPEFLHSSICFVQEDFTLDSSFASDGLLSDPITKLRLTLIFGLAPDDGLSHLFCNFEILGLRTRAAGR